MNYKLRATSEMLEWQKNKREHLLHTLLRCDATCKVISMEIHSSIGFNGYFEWKQCEHQEFAMSSVDLVRYLTTI